MEDVREDEQVWRDVYTQRHRKHLDRPVEQRRINSETKAVFGTRRLPIKEISTSLYDRVSLVYATAEGDRRAKNVQGSSGIQGWWLMTVRDVTGQGRCVRHSPQPDNPYHADIVLPDGQWETWEDGEVHLRHFLSIGTWQERAIP